MNDDALIKELKGHLRMLYEKKETVQVFLTLAVQCSNGKKYELPLRINAWTDISGNSASLRQFQIVSKEGNQCMLVVYDPNDTRHPLFTKLQANTGEKPCFQPRLTSDPSAAAERIVTTDVLEVLKTKLCLMLPFSFVNGLELTDTMTVQGVRLSPFRLLRGGWPYYWKYGYRNQETIPFRDYLAGLRLHEVRTMEERLKSGTVRNPYWVNNTEAAWKEGPYTILKNALAAKGLTPSDDELLLEVMKNFSFEDERDRFKDLSEIVCTLVEDVDRGIYGYTIYVLDVASPEWNEWRRRVVITGYTLMEKEPAPKGGLRVRRARRTRQKRRTTRRPRTKPV